MLDRDDPKKPAGALARLLDLENDIAERLARAREEAERVVARARDAAERAEEESSRDLDEELRRLGDRIAAESRAECLRIEEQARGEAGAFDGLDENRVGDFAGALIEHLLAALRSGTKGAP